MGPENDMRHWRSSTVAEGRGTHKHKLRAQAGGGKVRKDAARGHLEVKHTEPKSSPESQSPDSRRRNSERQAPDVNLPTERPHATSRLLIRTQKGRSGAVKQRMHLAAMVGSRTRRQHTGRLQRERDKLLLKLVVEGEASWEVSYDTFRQVAPWSSVSDRQAHGARWGSQSRALQSQQPQTRISTPKP
ncbi:hypothetical protein ON010_g7722 [Phytophthora cinnamomi]|nr:hypothetical protein ON010_g7722 [Phytophthora cinnamomi]